MYKVMAVIKTKHFSGKRAIRQTDIRGKAAQPPQTVIWTFRLQATTK